MANPTPYMYRLETDGTYTPLTKTQYESETTSSYAKGSTYRDRVEQLLKTETPTMKMKTLTPSVTRQIVEIVTPLHLPNYDRNQLHAEMWKTVLCFAHYANFDISVKLAEINAPIRDGWMKIKIESLEEARESNRSMDEEFSGNNYWSERFEANLNAVMAI